MSLAFNELSKEEQEILLLAPIKAAFLVGGADDDFDKVERRVAKELTHIKSYTSRGTLKDFYGIVASRFVDDLNHLVKVYPENASERNPQIRAELTEVRAILDKMKEGFRINLVNSLLEIGRYVAEASGGVLNMLSINKEEYRAIQNLGKILKEDVVVE